MLPSNYVYGIQCAAPDKFPKQDFKKCHFLTLAR